MKSGQNKTLLCYLWGARSGTWGIHYLYATDTEQGNVLPLTEPDPASVSARRFNPTGYINIQSAGVYRVTFKVKGNIGLRAVVLLLGTGTPNTSVASAINHVNTITDYPSGTIVDDWTTFSTIFPYRLMLLFPPIIKYILAGVAH